MEMGIQTVMVSVDELEGSVETKKTYDVPFPLLSDAEVTVHEQYKVVNALDGAGVERLKGFGIDIERWSKRKHHKIAIPAIFLIGRDGKVKFAHAAEDYKTRPDTDALLARLKTLTSQ